MKKVFRTLRNYIVSLRHYPIKTLKVIIYNIFVKYVSRTVAWFFITAIFGNSLFDNDIISSLERTLKSLWNSLRFLSFNISNFIENRVRDVLSWLTNRDFTKTSKSESWLPWPINNNNNKPSNPSMPPRETLDEYQAKIRKLQEENWRRMLESHKNDSEHPNGWSFNPSLSNWRDPYQWLKFGLASLCTAGFSFAVYYHWDTIGTFVHTFNFPIQTLPAVITTVTSNLPSFVSAMVTNTWEYVSDLRSIWSQFLSRNNHNDILRDELNSNPPQDIVLKDERTNVKGKARLLKDS